MKILLLADEENKMYWDLFKKEYFDGIDLIVSCGDLKASYLTFLATLVPVPLIYVHGNHDAKYDKTPPEGCICIDDDIFEFQGVRFLGLGGSMRYKLGEWQFTEKEMAKRVKKLKTKLWIHKGFDVLVTHAPAKDFHDDTDLCHNGFQVFRDLIDTYHPQLFVHGHVHMCYGRKFPREDMLGDTRVVNAYDKYIVEIDMDRVKGRQDRFLKKGLLELLQTGNKIHEKFDYL